jgi:hypothetical protein
VLRSQRPTRHAGLTLSRQCIGADRRLVPRFTATGLVLKVCDPNQHGLRDGSLVKWSWTVVIITVVLLCVLLPASRNELDVFYRRAKLILENAGTRDERLAIGQDSDVMVTFLANPDVQQAFDVLVGNIGRALDDRAELSVFARRIVASHCTKPWTEPILDT